MINVVNTLIETNSKKDPRMEKSLNTLSLMRFELNLLAI
jgi:hypothetical protein